MKTHVTLALILALAAPLYGRGPRINPAPPRRLLAATAAVVQPTPPTVEQISRSFLLIPFNVAGWQVTPGAPLYSHVDCLYNFGPFGPLEDFATCPIIVYAYQFDATATNGTLSEHYQVWLNIRINRTTGKQERYDQNVILGPPQCYSPFGC